MPCGESGRAWAIVRRSRDASLRESEEETASSLRRAGWRVAVVGRGNDFESVWTALVTSGDLE